MDTRFIVSLLLAVAFILYLIFKKRPSSAGQNNYYRGKAKLIARLTDKQGCFLCEFEQDGNIINAVYGDDSPELKVGDEVDIVWFGLYTSFPHVMSKENYDHDMEQRV